MSTSETPYMCVCVCVCVCVSKHVIWNLNINRICQISKMLNSKYVISKTVNTAYLLSEESNQSP